MKSEPKTFHLLEMRSQRMVPLRDWTAPENGLNTWPDTCRMSPLWVIDLTLRGDKVGREFTSCCRWQVEAWLPHTGTHRSTVTGSPGSLLLPPAAMCGWQMANWIPLHDILYGLVNEIIFRKKKKKIEMRRFSSELSSSYSAVISTFMSQIVFKKRNQ